MFDPTIFNIIAHSTYAENGRNTQASILETEKCTDEYFKRFPGYFQNSNLSFATCMKKNNFSIEGYWDEEKLEQVTIFALKCSNSSQSNIVCKSNDEIDRFFQENFFSFWKDDKSFDMNEYENPIKSKIKYFSRTLYPSHTKIARISIKGTDIILDNGIIYSSEKKMSTHSIDHLEYDDGKSDTIIAAVIINSSDIKYFKEDTKIVRFISKFGRIVECIVNWMLLQIVLQILDSLKLNF